MKLINLALLYIEEATYRYERAARLLELAAKDEHDRLLRTLNPDGQATQTDAPGNLQARLANGARSILDDAHRSEIAEFELRRTKAREGIPQELRDLI